MDFHETLWQLKIKRETALQMGGNDRIRKQHAKGRLTARERIDKLLDRGSFFEMGLLAHSAMKSMADKTPADGVICGYGTIADRRVAVIANDFTVLASTNAETNLKKTLQFKTQIKEKGGIPLIWLGESGGARMPDCQGAREFCTLSGGGTATLAPAYTHLRTHPFIFAAMGQCYGIPDFQAALADFVVQVKGSTLSVSGPRALARAVGQRDSAEEMGGWKVHSRITGLTDRVVESEEECFQMIRTFLQFMPDNHHRLPPSRPAPDASDNGAARILDHFTANRKRPYDMHPIVSCLTDWGEYLELKPDYGAMLITCLARIDGTVVGVLANNPMVQLGAMDVNGLDKLTGFICLCDSFNIPMIFLHDTPGHLVGKAAEQKKVGVKVVRAQQALFQATVPKISIIIRKSYGKACTNMCGPGAGYDFIAAWPTAEIGFMDPEIAADIVYGGLPEPERAANLERMIGDLSPYPAAGAYHIQDIIHPEDTRSYLIKVLGVVGDWKNKSMGQHHLANWPSKF
ncbi:carboxyl transferase domain protein [delta proteobacterium NaphS2]|nr:carboxyl transferase domain protein [delta proteobacterium NaphS2]